MAPHVLPVARGFAGGIRDLESGPAVFEKGTVAFVEWNGAAGNGGFRIGAVTIMNKPLLGLVLGGVLGVFDGLSAMFSAPETRPELLGIVIGSTMKGLIVGVAAGFFARKVNSVPAGIVFGLVVGAFLAWLIAFMNGKYYLEIILPGSILGIIVGFATQRYGRGSAATAA